MELTFTITLGLTLIALLATFLILLKGTKNFVYRSIGLASFVILLFTITYGYLGLMGKPKPLNYENWYMEEVEESEDGKKGEGESEGEEGDAEGEGEGEEAGQPGQGGSGGAAGQAGAILDMDILQWESDPGAGEAYLWLKKEKQIGEEGGPAMNYSFDTTTEEGQELLRQLREADQQAMSRGMQGRGKGTGIKLRIVIDRLLMAPTERFEFFVPPPKLLPPKTTPPPGLLFPDASAPNPNSRPAPPVAPEPQAGSGSYPTGRPGRPHGPGGWNGPVGVPDARPGLNE